MNPPTNQLRRVVITGMGIVSPLGSCKSAMWDALSAGQSGIDFLTLMPRLEDRVIFGGEARQFSGNIDDFGELAKDVKKTIRKALKMMCRETMMAVAVSQQAVADAGFGTEPMDPERSGVVFGSDYMLSPPDDFAEGMIKCGAAEDQYDYSRWGDEGLGEMNPLWMLKFLPNMPASHIAIINDLRGPNNSLTLREISGLAALREAAQTIQRGQADQMVAGATGTRLHPFKTVHAIQTEELAHPECKPAEASRPFDSNRTGMVVGEGAGAVVLEELESARRRGATIYGELAGTGLSTVTDVQLSGRRNQALASAARLALDEAGLSAEQLGHVNAHGLATRQCDADEAEAIASVLGSATESAPVVAAKSYFGNLGAGSCVVELIASTVALGKGNLFRTLNFETPEPQNPLAVTQHDDVPAGESFLKLSVTPQAQAGALVVTRCD